MPKAKSDSPRKKSKWPRYALAGLGLLALYHVLSGPSGVLNLYALRHANAEKRQALDSLENLRGELRREKLLLEKDSAYQEQAARKELGMSRPGEKVFRYMKAEKK